MVITDGVGGGGFGLLIAVGAACQNQTGQQTEQTKVFQHGVWRTSGGVNGVGRKPTGNDVWPNQP